MLSEIGMWVSKYLPCRSCRISGEQKTQLPKVPLHRQRIHRQQFHRMDSLSSKSGSTCRHTPNPADINQVRNSFLNQHIFRPFWLGEKTKGKNEVKHPISPFFFLYYCLSGWICIHKRVQKKNDGNSGRIRRVGQLKVCGFLFDSVFFAIDKTFSRRLVRR